MRCLGLSWNFFQSLCAVRRLVDLDGVCCFIVTLLVELLEWSSVEASVERAPSEGHQPVDRARYGTGLLQGQRWQRLRPPWSWQLTST